MPPMIRSLSLFVFISVLALTACSGDGAPAGNPASGTSGEGVEPATIPGEVYERDIVFATTFGDTTLITPWFFRASADSTGIDREVRALLSRSGAWDPFFDERWSTPPGRTPWRILPYGPMRIVVGESDALDRVIFRDGTREMELIFGETLAEWIGSRGEIFRMQEATVLLSNRLLDGILLDISRARRRADAPSGDWTFLFSDDGFQLFLEDPGSGGETPFRAWTRVDFREVQWPAVTVEWSEVRAYERARRDVPIAWSFTSSDHELRGELTVRATHVTIGEGEGPLLPIDGLFEVQGTVYAPGGVHEVRGFYRHVQN